jgi:hypothetical protein
VSDMADSIGLGRKLDGHRISEFVYGVVTALVAVAGLSGGHETEWWGAAAVVVAGAVAIWLTHAYSIMLSKRVAQGRRLSRQDIIGTLRGSWPIVVAGALIAAPIVPASLGVYTLDTALWISSFTGLGALALIGVLAGMVTRETVGHRFLLAGLSVGLGLLIVALEYVVHH